MIGKDCRIIFTVEHAGNRVPRKLKQQVDISERVLASHRGYDRGVYRLFASVRHLADASYFCDVTRLIVDCNRSRDSSELFSSYAMRLSEKQRKIVLREIYLPYRSRVVSRVNRYISNGNTVCHFSLHSFTPVRCGVKRTVDIGILYDPKSIIESVIAKRMQRYLRTIRPDLRVKFNQPYRGTDDGFTTFLRGRFPLSYAGLEIEVNQRFVKDGRLRQSMHETMHQTLSFASTSLRDIPLDLT